MYRAIYRAAEGNLMEDVFHGVRSVNEVIHYVGERALISVENEEGAIVYGDEKDEE